MNKKKISIWFWIEMFSPHIGALAEALAKRGFKVFYVANNMLFKERSKQGWKSPNIKKAKLILASNKKDFIRLALKAPEDSIHYSQGLRGNGQIKIAQNILPIMDDINPITIPKKIGPMALIYNLEA